MSIKTAVLFKTHFWNETTERLYNRCKMHASGSDVFIFYDNSNGRCDVPERLLNTENIILAPYRDIENLGLVWGDEEWNLGGYWYNGDYHQNLFIIEHPQYEYICSVEGDVFVNNNIDYIFSDMQCRDIHVVYKHEKNISDWWIFTETCRKFYDITNPVHRGLFCISFFSRAAAMLIARRRFEMSHLKRQDNLRNWPIGEAVMAEEPFLAGMKTEELSYYCDIFNHYDFTPAFLEKEADQLEGRTFVHPVTGLDRKFVVSNFEREQAGLTALAGIASGAFLDRARQINELEVYARLYHHPHIRNNKDLQKGILRQAQLNLPFPDKILVNGSLEVETTKVMEKFPAHYDNALAVLSPVPVYDPNTHIYFNEDTKFTVAVPSDGTMLVLSARDKDLPQKLNISAAMNNERHLSFEIHKFLQKGEMIFFTVNLPDDCRYVIIQKSVAQGVWINFLQFVPRIE